MKQYQRAQHQARATRLPVTPRSALQGGVAGGGGESEARRPGCPRAHTRQSPLLPAPLLPGCPSPPDPSQAGSQGPRRSAELPLKYLHYPVLLSLPGFISLP